MTTNPLKGKAIMSSITIRRWTGRKLDREITDEVNQQHNAEDDAGRYNKLLIPKEAFAEIHQITSAARKAHLVMTMPWWDEGTRLLPTAKYDEFANRFRQYERDFEEAADRFAKKYPHYKAAQKKRLNGMYKEDDYPDPSEVRGMFSFRKRIFECPGSDDFRVNLAREHLEDIKSSLEADIKEAFNDAMKEPVRRIINVVEKMVNKLNGYKPAQKVTVKDGAKKKRKTAQRAENSFRDSLVDNIREIVPLLEAFNLTEDAKLTALIARVDNELCTNDAEVLREDEDVRKAVAKAAEDILKQANALMA